MVKRFSGNTIVALLFKRAAPRRHLATTWAASTDRLRASRLERFKILLGEGTI